MNNGVPWEEEITWRDRKERHGDGPGSSLYNNPTRELTNQDPIVTTSIPSEGNTPNDITTFPRLHLLKAPPPFTSSH
jgi:hypothetical protein